MSKLSEVCDEIICTKSYMSIFNLGCFWGSIIGIVSMLLPGSPFALILGFATSSLFLCYLNRNKKHQNEQRK